MIAVELVDAPTPVPQVTPTKYGPAASALGTTNDTKEELMKADTAAFVVVFTQKVYEGEKPEPLTRATIPPAGVTRGITLETKGDAEGVGCMMHNIM